MLTATLAAAAAMLAAPIRADMIGNAFLNALTNAGRPLQPTGNRHGRRANRSARCWSQPGGDFDSVVSKMAAGNGMSQKSAGIFTIVAIATYCPAMIAPLLPNRLKG